MSERIPRFKRSPLSSNLQLTRRDELIIELVHKYRFLNSAHIVSALAGPKQPIVRRLQLLYHQGYLERPRAQLDYFQRGGSHPIVYGLGNKSNGVLKEKLKGSKIKWGPKNRAVGRMFLEHALMVAEIMVKVESACRTAGIRVIEDEELLKKGSTDPKPTCFRWRVPLTGGVKLGLIPDRVFALELEKEKRLIRIPFFLEADRGTMPVKRKSLAQTSFFRKLLAYEATWSQSIHRSQLGFDRFRVLTITTSQSRVESLG